MATLKWQALPAFKGDVPALLVSLNFGPSSYTLHVTDLANIWVERLDRRAVCLRAMNDQTSIDPTLGADQMVQLLAKIQAAVDLSSPDHDQTKLSLARGASAGELVLHTSCILPGDLDPLQWSVRLTKCPASELASELVLPLIQAQHARIHEIDSLLRSLKEKDAVIEKLVDKLETTGTGLENVFNLPGKRKGATREDAGDKIRGLAPFNEQEWKSGARSEAAPPNISSLMREVFGSGPLVRTQSDTGSFALVNGWWDQLGTEPVSAETASSQPEVEAKGPEVSTTAEDENEFESVATQPRSSQPGKDADAVQVDEATTDDETPPKTRLATRKAGHVGSIGRKKKTTSQSSQLHRSGDDTVSETDDEPVKPQGRKRKPPAPQSPPPQNSSASTLSAVPSPEGSETESDTEGSDGKATEVSRPTAKSPPGRSQGKLGRIGAKAKASLATPDEAEGGSSDSNKPRASAPKTKGRKLGAIGRKGRQEKRSQAESRAEEAPEVETDEQKAERKRAELAKELQSKASAGPRKKRRKF